MSHLINEQLCTPQLTSGWGGGGGGGGGGDWMQGSKSSVVYELVNNLFTFDLLSCIIISSPF